MGINSMTGFARSEGLALSGTLSWVWELRSVNGKGLDVRLRLPPGLEALEPKVRKAAADHLARGNVTLNLTVTYTDSASGYRINEDFLDTLIDLAKRKAADHAGEIGPANLDGLIAVKGVVEAADPEPKSDQDRQVRMDALLAGLDQALGSLVEARASEGAHLATLLFAQVDQMESLTSQAATLAAGRPEALKVRIKTQVEALLDASPALPEDRLAQEAALLATKADVREELDRLAAHIAQGREQLAKGSPCGRRLEFLSQEFNREANTLCSKSSDADLTTIGLELKAVIDQFREQIQNVE
ncbi:MAG: YicC family protein [Rhodospirillaceae bacterium]|nr:YicC family protein [Rhodospirillaceae bacterium]MBT5565832.1 YicC family protein [Rhodospirillaceae bacterium]MBT6090275.1 YicC family protein [Rhodospirillaceae bacterium]MBT6960863.1 YicC family protein [Rhodospirillaceae bacterium]MBT7449946.1 YicC family protein [Rhodospirillaceae bacterium]